MDINLKNLGLDYGESIIVLRLIIYAETILGNLYLIHFTFLSLA